MKILWICPTWPYPPTIGSKVRVMNLLKPLSERHDITLLSFINPSEDDSNIDVLKGLCRVRTIPFTNNPENYSLLNLLPYGVFGYTCQEMSRAIDEEISCDDYQVMIFEHLSMAQYLPHSFPGLKVLSLYDVESDQYRSLSKNKKGIKKRIWTYLEFLKLRHYETTVVDQFDLCLTVSKEDQDFFQKNTKGVFVEIPMGMDTSEYSPPSKTLSNSKHVSFLGALDYGANIEAVLYFYEEVFPKVQEEIPGCLFQIIGRRPPLEIQKLAENPQVIVTGTVEDIRPYLEKTSVFVSPIWAGAGSKTKIITAMASGLPIVSTTKGLEGVKCTPGADVLVADNADEFARTVITLLHDESLRSQVAALARKSAIKNYDMKVVADRFESFMRERILQLPGH
ncbi:MAG: glycosyltransferase [bacterium]|nr:glycosyltransferase [bacterium]